MIYSWVTIVQLEVFDAINMWKLKQIISKEIDDDIESRLNVGFVKLNHSN